jgi:hypothetical protein
VTQQRSRRRLTILALAALAAAVLVLVGVSLLQSGSAASGASAHHESSAERSARASRPAFRGGLSPGSYRIRYQARLWLGEAADAAEFFELRGVFEIRDAGSDGRAADQVLYVARLSEIDLDWGETAPANAAETERLEAQLGQAVVFAVDPKGAVSAVHLSDELDAFAHNTHKSLLALTQLVAPEDAQTRWQVQEIDTTGKYLAEYERPAADRLHKRKLHYVSVGRRGSSAGGLAVAGAAARADVGLSKMAVQLDDRGRVRKMDLRERIAVHHPTLPVARSEITLSLERSGEARRDAEDVQALLASYQRVAFDDPTPRQALRRGYDLAKVGDRDLPGILHALETLDLRNASERRPRESAYIALTALLRMDPDARAEVAERIAAGDALSTTLIAALGHAGNTGAQATLLSLLGQDDIPAAHKRELLRSMARASRPTEQTIASLEQAMEDEDLGRAAHYALGTAVESLARSAPERAGAPLARLIEHLQQAPSERSLIEALEALGNSGHPDMVTHVERATSDPREAVRRAALQALRKVATPGVDTILARSAWNDPDPRTRVTALSLMKRRAASETLLSALRYVVTQDPERRVRLESTRLLQRWPRAKTGSLLAWVARHDADARVRQEAGT